MIKLILFTLLVSLNYSGLRANSKESIRPSITFILGQDDKGESFYDLAKRYYLFNTNAERSYLVDSCSTILSLRNHLEHNLPHGAEAWGNITVVVHSNPWSGLSAKVYKGGDRTTTASLLKALSEKRIEPLSNHIVDAKTSLVLDACGLGSNKRLLEALKMALGGFDYEVPYVMSTERFVHFDIDDYGHIKKTEFQPYFAFYPTAYMPPLLHLQDDLKKSYPSESIDWLSIMKEDIRKNDTKLDRFNIPVKWLVNVEEGFDPILLNSNDYKLDFVRQQKGLMHILKEYNIPIKKFRWIMKFDDQSNNVYINGKATVLCVLIKK